MEGIHGVTLNIGKQVDYNVDGITQLRTKIIRLFGKKVCQIYHISPG